LEIEKTPAHGMEIEDQNPLSKRLLTALEKAWPGSESRRDATEGGAAQVFDES
jgi:hypothetical protein